MIKKLALVLSAFYLLAAIAMAVAKSFLVWIDDGEVEAYTWLIKAGLLIFVVYIVIVFVISNWNKIYRRFAG